MRSIVGRESAAPFAMCLATVVVLGACGADEPPTRVDVVVVEARPGLPQRLTRLELTVTATVDGGAAAIQHERVPSYGSDGLAPWVVSVKPLEGSHVGRVLYRFRVIGFVGEREVIRRQHRVVFVARTRLTLLVRLESSCVDVACDSDAHLTCSGGGCVDDYVPGCTVFVGDPPPFCLATDASIDAARDAGAPPIVDASRDLGLDGARPDATRPDADTSCGDAGPCGAARTCCDGVCVDTSNDPASCGECGRACLAGEQCNGGLCECASGLADCDPMQPGCETELASDPDHCGRCTTRCRGETPACLDGTCGRCVRDTDCAPGPPGCTEASRCIAGACELVPTPGTCVIAGSCYADGYYPPTFPCLVCRPDTDPFELTRSSVGTPCERNRCTVGSTCEAMGNCVGGTPRNCDDGVACTTDVCDPTRTVGCEHRNDGRSCVFEGQCYAEGSWHPNGTCEDCSAGTWLPRPDGTSCDDGVFCTDPDTCSAGRCTGVARVCAPDGLSCTEERCNEKRAECDVTLLPSRCRIGGVCYGNAQWNPAAVCSQVCAPGVSTSSWTDFTPAMAEGMGCGRDAICVDAMCTACPDGTHDCANMPRGCECADPSSCVAGACVAP